jgi:hypothetical protein
MAARLNKRHSELVLQRIQTSQLINRLQEHSLGTLKGPPCEDYPKGRPILLTDGQVRAACFLVERTLAKAEAPRTLAVTGTLTLEQLITGATGAPVSKR